MTRFAQILILVLGMALAFWLVGAVLGQCGPGGCPGGQCPTPQPWQGSQLQWPTPPQGSQGWRPSPQPPPRQPTAPWLVCVRQITSRSDDGSRGSNGSGTIVRMPGPEPFAGILTCAHILHANWTPGFTFDGKWRELSIVKIDALHDVALLRVKDREDCPKLPCLNLAREAAAQGSSVTWAGYPASGQNRLVTGNSTVTGYEDDNIYIKGKVEDGTSGGPIVSSGGLVAIISETNDAYGWHTVGPQVGWLRQWLLGCVPSRPAPPTRPPLVDVKPPPPYIPPSVDDPCVVLEATVIALEAQVAALQVHVANLERTAGGSGLPASPGPQGPPGKDAAIDYADLRVQLLDEESPNRLPPIHVEVIRGGVVLDSQDVFLGGTLPLELVPQGK